ncbi:hypothetical protein EVAR_54155_1 [Eumeta japonica]|uniref:Uncharacterized protein n=1 Tax=Eumeta variegata TaxID=151549 RepID=A0A4C1XZX6_EUMVA|nr:hypothetical protein EVAR_54155_1 [Eumeta japonica]
MDRDEPSSPASVNYSTRCMDNGAAPESRKRIDTGRRLRRSEVENRKARRHSAPRDAATLVKRINQTDKHWSIAALQFQIRVRGPDAHREGRGRYQTGTRP